jgi:protein-tyrosine phosphatase
MSKLVVSVLLCLILVGCGGSAGDASQRVLPIDIVAETRSEYRKLAMDGADNFRDLGGYKTSDGKTVKWGVLYRSDSLADLSDQDLVFIQRLGVKQIVDFRTPFEKEEDPDRIPEGINYVEREIDVEGTAVKELFAKISSGDIDDLNAVELMENANRAFVSSQQKIYGPHLKSLLDENNLPSVAHCTGGKDRAGFGAAITLLALGVPEETVINDFLLTNEYTEDKINKYIWMIRLGSFFQTDPEKIRPLLGVERSFIVAAIDQMKKEYGSIDNYFREGLSISDAEIQQLRNRFLEG